MSYLLDTNVVSELVRPKPDPEVLAWFGNTPDDALHLSVLSLGEVRKGVEKLEPSPKTGSVASLAGTGTDGLVWWIEFYPLTAVLQTGGGSCLPVRDVRCRRLTACWRPRPCITV